MSVPSGLRRQQLLVATQHQVAAHAGREVDHHVDVGVADALDHLGVQLGGRGAHARLGIAHVDVHHRRAGPAASMAESAICAGVTGTCGLLPVVSPAR